MGGEDVFLAQVEGYLMPPMRAGGKAWLLCLPARYISGPRYPSKSQESTKHMINLLGYEVSLKPLNLFGKRVRNHKVIYIYYIYIYTHKKKTGPIYIYITEHRRKQFLGLSYQTPATTLNICNDLMKSIQVDAGVVEGLK